jgi:hypothetical protein
MSSNRGLIAIIAVCQVITAICAIYVTSKVSRLRMDPIGVISVDAPYAMRVKVVQ